jgi:hypothetical protein
VSVITSETVELDELRARGGPLAALLLSITLGAKRKPATVD